MSKFTTLGIRAYARMPSHAKRVDEARRCVEVALEKCAQPYVAFSCGKDSAAMLHMVQQFVPGIEARFIRWTESELLDDFERVIREWQARGINLTILDLHRDSIFERGGDRWQQLQELSPCDGYFIGLRAEESRARRMTLKAHGDIYRMANGLLRISPLAWWKTEDVAAYTVTHDLPTLNAYVTDGFDQRTSARVPREEVRSESLTALRIRDPQRWNLLCAKYPEVATYG